eukprot:gene27229-2484_t
MEVQMGNLPDLPPRLGDETKTATCACAHGSTTVAVDTSIFPAKSFRIRAAGTSEQPPVGRPTAVCPSAALPDVTSLPQAPPDDLQQMHPEMNLLADEASSGYQKPRLYS